MKTNFSFATMLSTLFNNYTFIYRFIDFTLYIFLSRCFQRHLLQIFHMWEQVSMMNVPFYQQCIRSSLQSYEWKGVI